MGYIYRVVRLASKWQAHKSDILNDENELDSMVSLVHNGSVVCFTDDLDHFADEMGILREEIEVVE